MTKVTFYKLAKDAPSLKLVCQLIKKACLSQQKVLCLVADDQTAEQLDQLAIELGKPPLALTLDDLISAAEARCRG